MGILQTLQDTCSVNMIGWTCIVRSGRLRFRDLGGVQWITTREKHGIILLSSPILSLFFFWLVRPKIRCAFHPWFGEGFKGK